MSTNTLLFAWRTITAIDGTGAFAPFTGWMVTTGITKARGALEIIGKNGELTFALACQVTDDPHDPPGATTFTVIGSAATADGVQIQADWTTLTTVTDAKQYIRFGGVPKLSSGATLATASVSGKVELIRS